MIYTGVQIAKEIRNMLRSDVYEETQYVEVFSYEISMENNWESYEELDYPILIKAIDVGLERIKEKIGIKEENIIELNKEKELYLCEKTESNYITNNTKWFVTIKSNEEYTDEDFREKVKEYIDAKTKNKEKRRSLNLEI